MRPCRHHRSAARPDAVSWARRPGRVAAARPGRHFPGSYQRAARAAAPADPDAEDACAVGFGTGSGRHVLSHSAWELRGGSLPVSRYVAIVPSTQRLPNNESACVVPPGSASSTECGNSLRTSRLPGNGVAASSVSSISRALRIALPRPSEPRTTGRWAGAGQYRQGALNQAWPQVSNGAILFTAVLSLSQTAQLVGHCTSVH